MFALLRKTHHESLAQLTITAERWLGSTPESTLLVRDLCITTAFALGWDIEEVRRLRVACLMRNIGFYSIANFLDELDMHIELPPHSFNQHTTLGARLLAGSRSKTINMALQIAMHHHEAWDGSGYPQQEFQDAIPLSARIVRLAEHLADSILTEEELILERTIQSVKDEAGRTLDPKLVSLVCKNDCGFLNQHIDAPRESADWNEVVECFRHHHPHLANKSWLTERDFGKRIYY